MEVAGNLGTVGPYFFGAVRELTGSFTLALTAGGVSLILASLIASPIRQRRQAERTLGSIIGQGRTSAR